MSKRTVIGQNQAIMLVRRQVDREGKKGGKDNAASKQGKWPLLRYHCSEWLTRRLAKKRDDYSLGQQVSLLSAC